MASIQEIQAAVSELPPSDLSAFREWFAQFDAKVWDRQFEQDATAGRLDSLAEEALADLREGRCKDI